MVRGKHGKSRKSAMGLEANRSAAAQILPDACRQRSHAADFFTHASPQAGKTALVLRQGPFRCATAQDAFLQQPAGNGNGTVNANSAIALGAGRATREAQPDPVKELEAIYAAQHAELDKRDAVEAANIVSNAEAELRIEE